MAEPIDPENPERDSPIRNVAENIGNINDDDTWRREVMASLKMIEGDLSDISQDTMQMTNELSDIGNVMSWFKEGIVEMGEVIMEGLNNFAAKFDELKDMEALRGSREDMLERERMLEESRRKDDGFVVGGERTGGGFLSKLMSGEGIGSKIIEFLMSPLALLAAGFGLAISVAKLMALGIVGAIAVVALWGALSAVTDLLKKGREKGLKGTELAMYVGKEMLATAKHILGVIFTAIGYLTIGEENTEKISQWLSQPVTKILKDTAYAILDSLTSLFEKGVLKLYGPAGTLEIDVIKAAQNLSAWMIKSIHKAIMGISLASIDIATVVVPELIKLAVAIVKAIPKLLSPKNWIKYLVGIGSRTEEEIKKEAEDLGKEVARIDGVIVQKYNLMREAIKNGNDEMVSNLQDDIATLEESKKELQETQESWWTRMKEGYLRYNNEIRDAVLEALGIEHEDGVPMWFVNTTDSIKEKVGGFFDDILSKIKEFDASDLLNSFFEAIRNKVTRILSYDYWFGPEKAPEAPQAQEVPNESIHPKNVQPKIDRELQVQPKVETPLEVPDTSGIVVPPLPSMEREREVVPKLTYDTRPVPHYSKLIRPASYKAMEVKREIMKPVVDRYRESMSEPVENKYMRFRLDQQPKVGMKEDELPDQLKNFLEPPYPENTYGTRQPPKLPPLPTEKPWPFRSESPTEWHPSIRDIEKLDIGPEESGERYIYPEERRRRSDIQRPQVIKAGFTGTAAAFLALGALGKYQAYREQFKKENFDTLGIDPSDLGKNFIVPDEGIKKDTANVVAEHEKAELMVRNTQDGSQTNVVRGGDTVVSNSVRNTFGGYPNAHIASKLTDTKTFRT